MARWLVTACGVDSGQQYIGCTTNQPRRCVQEAVRERAADLLPLLQDPNAYFYVCGLKSMEEGVVLALRDIAQAAGLDWDSLAARLKLEARLHLETY